MFIDHKWHVEAIVMMFCTYLFITYCTHVHIQKYDEGAVRNRIRKMTGIDSVNRKQEIWMEGWRLVSGVLETPVRLRPSLVCLIFFSAIDSLLSCLPFSFWNAVPVPKRKYACLFSRLSLYKYL